MKRFKSKLLSMVIAMIMGISLIGCGPKKIVFEEGLSKYNGQSYETVEEEFEKLGFTDITLSKINDLSIEDKDKVGTVEKITIDGDDKNIKEKEFTVESKIEIYYHALKLHKANIKIEFPSNWFFSKYDVDFYINDEKKDTLAHGEDKELSYELEEGNYTLKFVNSEDSSVKGETEIELKSDLEASYKIECGFSDIDVDVQYLDYDIELAEDEVKVTFDSSEFKKDKYKNYTAAVEMLKELGFTNVREKILYSNAGDEKSIENVYIKGNADYKKGDIFKKNVKVTVQYYMSKEKDPEYIAEQKEKEQKEKEEKEKAEKEAKEEQEILDSSIYEYAFVRKNSNYNQYIVIDIDDMIVRNFTTNDTGVLVGQITRGSTDATIIEILFSDGVDQWTEYLQFDPTRTSSKAVLEDSFGDHYDYSSCSIAEAEKCLRKSGYHDIG